MSGVEVGTSASCLAGGFEFEVGTSVLEHPPADNSEIRQIAVAVNAVVRFGNKLVKAECWVLAVFFIFMVISPAQP
jgi:hypothetical protein